MVQGPSEVFRIVDDQAASNTKLCHGIEFCFTEIPALTLGLFAPVGSNTETDSDCRPATFHRGAFGVKAPFSMQQ